MFYTDFLKNQKHLDDYADKLINDLEQSAQDIRSWLQCLTSDSESTEKTDTIQFPKTPLATRRIRKRPKVETITEDDEIGQFEARELSNQSAEVSFLNLSTASSCSTRSSRTASKNAYMKISAQSKQTLNQKLRRPTRSKPGVHFIQPLVPTAKGRRVKRQKSSESLQDVSIASSFASARESVNLDEEMPGPSGTNLDDSIQIVEQPKRIFTNTRLNSTTRATKVAVAKDKVSVAVVAQEIVNISPQTKKQSRIEVQLQKTAARPLKAAELMPSPDIFTDEDFNDKKEIAGKPVPATNVVDGPNVELTRPTIIVTPLAEMTGSSYKPIPAPRTLSPLVTAPQCKSPQVFNPYKVESVKKRVMAYEMLGTLSEELSPARASAVAENVPMRVTRTKTRALARQTKDQAEEQRVEQSTLLKLARTSVKRAKRISLAKQQRMEASQYLNSSGKENSILDSDSRHHLPPPLNTGSGKSKTTPLTNSKPVRLNVLTSANRIHIQNTSAKNLENKSNILAYETFITHAAKPVVEDIEEKKREEVKRRQEKAEEAQRKRKELMASKREEQRKKREDKQIKAMQAREAMEREKVEQKQRVEREKEEKARQLAEREEKQREEQVKRKQQAQQKAHEFEERRKQEEAARLARIREQEEEQRRAELQRKREEAEAEKQYMKRLAQEKEAAAAAAKQQVATVKKKVVEPAPLNGTFTLPAKKVERPPLKVESDVDYYLPDISEGGSSSEDERPRSKVPSWANNSLLKPQHWLQETIPLAAWNAMFSSHAQTPDLALIFNNQKLRDMKRTSSAVWRTPPRFSRMPQQGQH